MSLPKNIDPGKSNSRPRRTNAQSDDEFASEITRCAKITGAGRSAIAVIYLRGPNAAAIVADCFESVTKRPFLPSQIRYGRWTGQHQEGLASESVVVTPLTETDFEIHCHGGPAATQRIIEDLAECGVIAVEPEHLSPAEDLLVQEAHAVLARCLTARTAAIAMDQARGVMSEWAKDQLRAIKGQPSHHQSVCEEARIVVRHGEYGVRLGQPFRVVLSGPPNVGKSSLLNAILGYDRSITFDEAGTTRDVLHADTVIEGLPIRLSDTAGIRESDEPLEQQGVARAQIAAEQADLLIVVREPGSLATQAEQAEGRTGLDSSSTRIIRVLNKSDKLVHSEMADFGDVATNALTGDGVGELMSAIAVKLSDSIPEPGSPVPITERQATLLSEIAVTKDVEVITGKLQELLGVNI